MVFARTQDQRNRAHIPPEIWGGGREARMVILVVAVVVVVWCQFHPPLKVFPFLPAILFG